METQKNKLNLARKWRSKNFDQIIGQNLSIKILKNSLFLDHYFPVYLFSGQRGCGKTTTARVFTAALNCENLKKFRSNPKSELLPCLTCKSCELVKVGKHPDFIEIDAASHTGVDNVRQIIEASSLLPVMGKKRIYLIDEAHMLSKAAFNAFLKVLEEPPSSVLFILATTDPNKIIDTVRSRCFQLFFNAIDSNHLETHLKKICEVENIKYDLEALRLIINESEGCARDAINMLERVRFAGNEISKELVFESLGYPDIDDLINLFEILLIKKDSKELLELLDKINLEKHAPDFIWKKLLSLVRDTWRLKLGVGIINSYSSLEKLTVIAKNCELDNLIDLLNSFCIQEQIFVRSAYPHLFLELFFISIVKKND